MPWKKLKEKVDQYAIELKNTAVLSSTELSSVVANSDWFKSFNDYSSEVSKAMDAEFLLKLKGEVTEKMAPSYHRIVDGGHGFFSSIEKAQEIGEKNRWTDFETFQEWTKSYLTDLSSPAGMPVFGKSTEYIYNFLKNIGVSEEMARDILTVNGQEAVEALLSGGITFLSLYFAWKKEDKELFSKTVTSILLTSAIFMNPVTMLFGLVGLAIGYQKLVNKEAAARGAITTTSGLLVSALIPGPALLGAIPAIVLSIYISKKMGTTFKPIEHGQAFIKLVTSQEFKTLTAKMYEELMAAYQKKAAA